MKKLIAILLLVLTTSTAFSQCFVNANIISGCSPNCNVTVVLNLQGANPPFMVTVTGPSYSFGPAQATSVLTLNNLCPGTYAVSVTDAVSNTCSTNFTVVPYNPLSVSVSTTNATCSSCSDGSAILTVTGGTAPYVYQWNTGSTMPYANQLAPGVYQVTVTDANGCSVSQSFIIGFGGSTTNLSLSGTVFYDGNSNGVQDSGEPGMGNRQMQLTPGPITMISNNNGTYGLVIPSGNYTVDYIAQPGWHLTSANSSYNVNLNSTPVTGLDFGLAPDSSSASGYLSLTSGFPRCYWTVPYYLYFTNTGYTILDGSLNVSFDPLLNFASTTVPPFSQSGNNLTWTFTNLAPGQAFSTTVYFTEPGPLSSLYNTFSVNATDAQGGQFANSASLNQLVSCSWDPNDKAVYPAGVSSQHYVAMDEWLNYQIRFQNTGNDTAFKVVVLDTIDNGIDLSSFTLMGASHPVQTEIRANREVVFTFNNILLPDSNVNEPGSHGYVLYRVKGLTSNTDPTMVQNTAYIYFDQNSAVQTNTAFSTLSDNFLGLSSLTGISGSFNLTPNPMTDRGVLNCSDCHGIYRLKMTDMQGRVVSTFQSGSGPWEIKRNGLSSGLYLLEITPQGNGTGERIRILMH